MVELPENSVKRMKVTKEVLDKLFYYNKKKGTLTRKAKSFRHRKGHVYKHSTVKVTVMNVPMTITTVIWIIVTGHKPLGLVRLIKPKAGYRWCNLYQPYELYQCQMLSLLKTKRGISYDGLKKVFVTFGPKLNGEKKMKNFFRSKDFIEVRRQRDIYYKNLALEDI